MDFLHTVQIPADGLIMKYPVAESTERIQRSRDILPLTILLGHERERPAQVFPQQTFIFAVQQGDPKSKCQFCNNLRWRDAFMPSRYLFARLCNIYLSIRLVEKTFSKKCLLHSIFVVLLHRSPGRSSPSFQLLVMNPGFFISCCKVTLFH